MPKGVKKQLTRGRPKTAVNKADLPEKPLKPTKAAVPKLPSTSELPKEIIGSHMGLMLASPAASTGPAIKGPVKLPPRGRKAPPV